MLADLGVGECVVKLPNGAEETLAVSGGFVDVSRQGVTVLADTAEFANEIDADRAEAALARAHDLLTGVDSLSPADREDASLAVRRAQARLRIARGGR